MYLILQRIGGDLFGGAYLTIYKPTQGTHHEHVHSIIPHIESVRRSVCASDFIPLTRFKLVHTHADTQCPYSTNSNLKALWPLDNFEGTEETYKCMYINSLVVCISPSSFRILLPSCSSFRPSVPTSLGFLNWRIPPPHPMLSLSRACKVQLHVETVPPTCWAVGRSLRRATETAVKLCVGEWTTPTVSHVL